jgi:hypothetical protein
MGLRLPLRTHRQALPLVVELSRLKPQEQQQQVYSHFGKRCRTPKRIGAYSGEVYLMTAEMLMVLICAYLIGIICWTSSAFKSKDWDGDWKSEYKRSMGGK